MKGDDELTMHPTQATHKITQPSPELVQEVLDILLDNGPMTAMAVCEFKHGVHNVWHGRFTSVVSALHSLCNQRRVARTGSEPFYLYTAASEEAA